MRVYNRWGELVFETNDPNGAWDGTFNGERLTTDVFAYVINIVCLNGDEYDKQGNVSLLK